MIKTKTISMAALLLVAGAIVPLAIADSTAIDALEDQLEQINSKYGFMPQPVLTNEQWNQYDSEWQAIEAQKQPYYQELDALDSEYDRIWQEIDRIDEQGMAIDEKYGFQTDYPELTPEQWESYDAETRGIHQQIDQYWDAVDAQYEAKLFEIYAEFGITESATYSEAPGFFEDLDEVFMDAEFEIYDLYYDDLSDEEKARIYQQMSDVAPQIAAVYEKHGYSFPLETPEEFASFGERLLELEKIYD